MVGQAHHITPPRVYFIVYILLLALLGVTVGLYVLHLGPVMSIVAAMIVAVIKASLVVLFFMQVYYSSKLTWVWAALGFLWLFFLGGIIVDYVSRTFRMRDGVPFDPPYSATKKPGPGAAHSTGGGH